jgi:hypothetical protein
VLARGIVDILLEADWPPEDIEALVDKSMYSFMWSNDKDQWTLQYKLLAQQSDGNVNFNYGETHHKGVYNLRFSVYLRYGREDAGYRHRWGIGTRWRGVNVAMSVDALKQVFEGLVRGPITKMCAAGNPSKQKLVGAVNSLVKKISWVWNPGPSGKATPEQIAALQARFDYGKTNKRYNKMGLFGDSRAQGRETDYDYLSQDDIQFWNSIADEYDARAQA